MPEFSTPKPITVAVTLNKGRLSVVAGDRADTVVHVRPANRSSAADAKAAEQTAVEYASGRLLIKAPEPHWLSGVFGNSASVDVTIELPAGSSVQVEAAKAEVRTEGRLKDVRLDCVSGEVHLDHVELLHVDTVFAHIAVGDVSKYANVNGVSGKTRLTRVSGSAVVKGVNGDVWIGESGSDLHVSTAGGSIFVDEAGEGVTAKTAGGTIRLGRVQRGEAELLTGSGEIEIGIGEGSVAWIDAHSSMGSVRNTMQAKDGPSPHGDMVKVRARSRHGDIMIHRAAASPQASG
ncbi:DUF4097 family beta strand repeat-containing protein [Streptomyces sp. NPDC047886]|uniref:DUF4097 family beta strand repeat-containing protein n=1 Tax=Streptomyces sp. NPDC047886 TaxID=3365490 RepID=UPI00371EA6C9